MRGVLVDEMSGHEPSCCESACPEHLEGVILEKAGCQVEVYRCIKSVCLVILISLSLSPTSSQGRMSHAAHHHQTSAAHSI